MSITATSLRIPEGFGVNNLRFEQHEIAAPGDEEVLVQFHAASLNHRDLLIAKGQYNPRMALPRTLGSDAAGEVVAVGAGVTRFKVGDRVTSLFFQRWIDGPMPADAARHALGEAIDGVFCTHRIFHESGVIATPEYLSDAEAATLPCAALTAWNALRCNGNLQPGQTVLVLGTGGVSVFALQIAKTLGAKVIATSSSDEKLARVRALGADHEINYRTSPDWHREVLRITERCGVDHVVEVGGAGTLAQSLKSVRPGGVVHLIGVLAPANGTGPDVTPILMRALRVIGVLVGNRSMFGQMNDTLTAHRVRPVIDRVFPFKEAVDAFRHLESGAHFGKIVLDLG